MKRFYLLKIFLIACILGIYGGGSAVAQTKVIYETGFEESDFTSGNNYQNANEKQYGPEGYKWAVVMGTPSTTDKISGTKSLQMRYYTSDTYKDVTPYARTTFALNSVSHITFKAKYKTGKGNALVQHSIDDGVTWSEGNVYTLTTTATQYTYNVSDDGENNVIFKLSFIDRTTNKAVFFIDDFVVYGIDKSTVELPSSEISFVTPSYIITKDETFTGQTLNNPNNVEVTYSSSNEAVATVDAENGAVTFGKATGTTTIKATFAGNETYKAESASYTITVNAGTLKGIAELIEQVRADNSEEDKEYTVELTNAVVTGVVGSNAYIQEGDYGILFYKYDHDLVVGNTYTGTATVTACMYSLSPEIKNISGVTAVDGTVPEVVEVSVDDLNNDIANKTYKYIARRIKIVEAKVTSGTSKRKATVEQSGASIEVYDQLNKSGNPITLTANNTVNVTGYLSISSSEPRFNVIAHSDVEVLAGKENPTFAFSETAVTIFVGDEFTAPTLTNTSDGTVTYDSSDKSVATVDASGNVTIIGKGETTITASVTETDDYYAATAEYTLTVKSMEGLTKFTLVTSADDLVIGARYIIANTKAGKVLNEERANNFGVTDASFSDNIVYIEEGVQARVFELGGAEGAYTLKNDGRYLGSTNTGGNYLRLSTDFGNNTTANITIDASGNSSIIFNGSDDENILLFNNTLFSCYGTGSSVDTPVQLYRCDIGTLNIPSVEGYGTFFTDKAFVMPEGVQGSLVTNAVEGKLTLGWEYQEGATVPAKTALLLKGAQGDHTYAVTSTTEVAPTENMLKGSMDNSLTEGNSGDKFYKLSYNNDGKIGFFWGGDNGAAFENKAGKAYLVISQALASKVSGFILDDNEVTGITSVGVQQNDGAIYNMQGVRVQNANRKGIYIINGKKVIK